MSQLPLFEIPTWTVTELTLYLRDLIENDETLQDVWVRGEVSNLSRPQSGHLYFTLKDNLSALRCVMWREAVRRLSFTPRDGIALEAHGSLGIYEVQGQYQLYADVLRPLGEGALFQEFLRIKARLEAEGLFAPERKRPIPQWPHTIGIITSPTGAAIQDMLNTIQRRYPLTSVVIAPTTVQGIEAPQGIISALQIINRLTHPDVILLARGGGSIEDLWAFNDENVARAIAASPSPVITGVGHETDFTIADFASDLRAPTPTAAAELATPNRDDLRMALGDYNQRMARGLQSILISERWQLNRLETRLSLRSPLVRVRTDRQRLDELSRRAVSAFNYSVQLKRAHIANLEGRLYSLSPVNVLQRGYAIVTLPDQKIVSHVGQVHPSDLLSVQVSDGRFGVRVEGDDASDSQ